MPYQSVALGILLGVGIATAAVLYFLSQIEPESYSNHNEPPPDTSLRNWDRRHSTNAARRRRRARRNVDTVCAICLDELRSGLKTLSCDHIFHKVCIDKWLREAVNENQGCPVCRTRASF